jgi:hypothetical protein
MEEPRKKKIELPDITGIPSLLLGGFMIYSYFDTNDDNNKKLLVFGLGGLSIYVYGKKTDLF